MEDIQLLPIIYQDSTKNTLTIYHGETDDPPILILPAMGIRASYYGKLSKHLSQKQGRTIVTIDYRGHGYSSVRPSKSLDFGFKEWLDDLHEVVRQLQKTMSIDQIEILGHSIGGQLGCLYYSTNPAHIRKLTMIGSSLPHYKIWKGWGKLKLWIGAYLSGLISQAWGYFPGHLTGFAGKEAKGIMRDWAWVARTGKYEPNLSSTNYEDKLHALSPNLHAISFPNDNLAPPYTVPFLIKKFGGHKNITHSVVEGFNHFDWVRRPEEISKWILAKK